jgi:arabinose-5-phosphate isomerase
MSINPAPRPGIAHILFKISSSIPVILLQPLLCPSHSSVASAHCCPAAAISAAIILSHRNNERYILPFARKNLQMHPVASGPEARMPHLYDQGSTMVLDSFPDHPMNVDISAIGCRTTTGYFGINSALTPPESVIADDAKSEAPDSDIECEFNKHTSAKILARARSVLQDEAQSICTLSALLAMKTLIPFIRIMHQCRGHIILTGIGKSGLIAQKISATLASTGRPSFFLHSTEALHGDMGRISRRDIVIALSNSGESPEISQIARSLKATTFRIDEGSSDDEYMDNPFSGTKFLLITGNARSSLSRFADAVLCIGDMAEACSFNVVPTNTTTAMLALGDALALCLFELLSGRRYSIKTFANFHPGGSLGKKLVRVQQVMSPCGSLVQTSDSLREIIATLDLNANGKNSTVVIVDSAYRFVRLFTDRDLRQLLVRYSDGTSLSLDAPIREGLTLLEQPQHPACLLNQKMLVGDAHRLMEARGVHTAVVTDDKQFPIGMISI